MEANIFDVADDMSFPWLPAYAEAIEQQQQHLQPSSPLLSSVGATSGGCTSSRMLETIVEETSSDDDADGSRSGSRSRQSRPRTSEGDCCGGNGWSQYDQVWSSAGSDTGSVIRVDTPSDQDAMSERDFICPPKRRRQDQQDLDGACSNSGSSSSNNSSNEELFNGGSTGELTVIVTAPPNTALTTNGGYYGGIGALRKARYCELDQHQLQQQQNLEVNEYFMRRHNEPRLRFDEIGHDLFTAPGGPDSDSLSYASLSRSSSLIQFESLERQLQNELQAASVGSGSVPSLTTIDVGGSVSGGGSANVGVGVEGFKKSLVTASKLKGGGVVNGKQSQPVLNNSDSELYSSSASSGGDSSGGSSCNYASDECDLNQHTVSPSSEESGRVTKGSSSDEADGPVQQLLLVRACPQRCSERRLNRQNAAKNSIESLSEDSGYCDHLHFNMNNLRVRSKSLTNFGGSADNVNMFMEPTPVDFYERHVSFQENRLSTVCDVDEEEEEQQQQQQVTGESNKYEHPGWYGAKTNIHNCTKIDLDASKQQQQQPFVVQTKVMPTSSSSSSSSSSTSPTSSQNASTDSLERPISSTDLDRHQPKPKNSNHRDEHASRKRPRTVISASSPDLFGVHAGSQVLLRRKQQSRKPSNDLLEFSVSSVPECLNLCGGEDFGHQSESLDSLCESATSSGNYCSWNVPQEASVASKNFDLYDFREQEQEAKVVVKKVTFQAAKPRVNIRASYANLTVLDYSDEEDGGRQYYLNRNTFRTSSGTRLGGVREMAKREEDEEERLFPVDGDEKNVFNSLLDEISTHFDRNLSIINDQAEAYEPIAAFLHEQRSAASGTTFSALVAPPQPPPRRTQIKTNPHHSQAAAVTTIVVTQPDVKRRTFDQDPTNLVTCYAASLERCTFDPSETSLNRYDSKSSELNQPRSYAPVKREFVASTPNLNYYYSGGGYGDCEEGLHNSLKNVSCLEIGSRSTGILATASSSKCGLSKGVSFCPIVSEIIWKDNSSELDPDDNASVISNQDFEIDIDDEDFDQDDAEHASLTQTNTLINANSIETGLCELINTPHPSSTDYHHQRPVDSHQLRLPTPPERSPRENGDVTTILSQERIDDRKRDGHSSDVNNAPTPTLPDVSLESTLSNEVIIAECRTETMASAIANGDASKSLIAAESAPNTSDDQQVQGAAAAVATATPPKFVNNNNNLIKNFKNGKAEKKGKTFLSRLSSGFRFSFRGKGKKNKDGGGVTGKTGSTGGAIAGRSDKQQQQNNEKVSADFIYIPLKDPAAKQGQQSQSNGINNGEIAAASSEVDDEEHYLRQMNTVGLEDCAKDEPDRVYDPNETDLTFRSDSTSILNSTATSQAGNTASAHKNHVLSGKPPLPKQPPRVVGVCAKRSTPVRAHAQTRASSTPPRTEIDPEDDGEGYYRQYAAETAADSSRTSSVGGRRYRANSTQSGPGAAAAGDNYFNHIMGSEQKIGLIETNLDTHETVISGKTRSLMELGGGGPLSHQLQVHQVVISGNNSGGGVKVNGIKDHRQTAVNGNGVNEPGRPHKSMEFLLDKENQRNVLPPENELQKSHETGTNLSEHQLRVQASLQRLNIPDWYKQYSGKDGQPPNSNTPQGPGAPGTGAGTGILRKRNSDVGRWTGLSSKTTSLSSLGSHRSDRSPVMLSPSAHSHHGGQTGFSRWSTSHLNSNQTSPSVSTRGSFTRGGLNASVISGYSTASTTVGATAGAPGAPGTIRNSFRQPYLGWRSQEKLSQPRTPAERLASSLLSQQKAKEQQQQQAQNHNLQQQKSDPVVTPEIQSSIKEVTSAIVHYVNDQTNRHSRSRSTSPSQRCWLESSFVGTRPLDSPQTPMIDGTQQQHQQVAGDHYRYNAGRMNGVGESTLI